MDIAPDNIHPQRISYTIRQVTEATGLSKSFIYKLLSEGQLRRCKVGKRTYILHDDLAEFLRHCPTKKWTGRRVA